MGFLYTLLCSIRINTTSFSKKEEKSTFLLIVTSYYFCHFFRLTYFLHCKKLKPLNIKIYMYCLIKIQKG